MRKRGFTPHNFECYFLFDGNIARENDLIQFYTFTCWKARGIAVGRVSIIVENRNSDGILNH